MTLTLGKDPDGTVVISGVLPDGASFNHRVKLDGTIIGNHTTRKDVRTETIIRPSEPPQVEVYFLTKDFKWRSQSDTLLDRDSGLVRPVEREKGGLVTVTDRQSSAPFIT